MTTAVIPDEILNIGRLLLSQDNRGTDRPMFIVQQKREYVTDADYNDAEIRWREDGNGDYSEVSELRAKRLESIYKSRYEILDGYERFAVMFVWEFVTACLTEQGCEDYLSINKHNLRETRIYADGSYRNHEYKVIRDWLMLLASSEASL